MLRCPHAPTFRPRAAVALLGARRPIAAAARGSSSENTARYESRDRPFLEAKVRALCPSCQVIAESADQDAARQQQAEAAITLGAKVPVLDAVDVKVPSVLVDTVIG
ncbi:hypothetical protein FSW04_05890 [Baekduia soli]|uniref:Uncharacterized protein n=1 Tax=Baekduia soli TaxID=496014 RepID=A0A5B8U2D1_9ACTN|nr:hypothetical protein [Baekduia soli]QEC47166.1 hypothetical protein FSW04_05890 [Baekduia soli]